MTRILCIGDIIGKPGRKVVKHIVPKLRKEEAIDFVIANSDNVTSGMGINKENAEDLLQAGVDLLTSGNHIWRHRDIIDELEKPNPTIIRPANFPVSNPGKGYAVMKIPGSEITIAVVNLQCRGFMSMSINCPFLAGDEILNIPEVAQAQIKVIDIHGETTSEKQAIFHYFNGRVTHIFGTHTHVQTSDAHVSERGTSFITDAGACLAVDSVIGFEVAGSLRKFLTQMPEKYEVEEKGSCRLCGCVVDIDENTGHALAIKAVAITLTF